jgi:hypothetical protein
MRFSTICNLGVSALFILLSIGNADASSQAPSAAHSETQRHSTKHESKEPPDVYPGPKARWAPCGIPDRRTKVVRLFFRAASGATQPQMATGRATLACGSEEWGYRHILKRHIHDWEGIAIYDNVNWREAADWGMWNALKYPDQIVYRADNDTFSYIRTINLKNKKTKETVRTAKVFVVVAHKTKNIITAYPRM